MLRNSLLWNVFNAGRSLPRSSKVFLAGGQPVAAQVGRLVMQALTFGLWGQIFPKRQNRKEESLKDRSEPVDSDSSHQV